jgi:hypothetical protein
MTIARVAGHDFDLQVATVEEAVAAVDPEPIREHYAIVGGRRYPPKQVLAEVTGLDRADFTTHQARAILRRLGFGVYRRAKPVADQTTAAAGPHGGVEAAALAPYQGRWVAQDGLQVLFEADGPEAVVRWLRRHGRTARVWRVPASSLEAGSAQSTP